MKITGLNSRFFNKKLNLSYTGNDANNSLFNKRASVVKKSKPININNRSKNISSAASNNVSNDVLNDVSNDVSNSIVKNIDDDIIVNKLQNIHSKLKINYGSLTDEFPEQKMVVKYLKGHEKVLEIGGNIGRNSLVIASILENNNNFVTLESDTDISNQLISNRDLNNFNFHIENAAISKRILIQTGWQTIPSETLLPHYNFVNIITYDELKNKYNINFDTLILDCEGAFYYILIDMPEILNNINLIIMENDYIEIEKKNFVDEILIKNNFIVDYTEKGGWGPCYDNFFEVWKRETL